MDSNFDIIISTYSWGFHYPVDTYLDEVASKLAPSGVLILDIRHNTPGEDFLRAQGWTVEFITNEIKSRRAVCRRVR
jgi:hypothetical protein